MTLRSCCYQVDGETCGEEAEKVYQYSEGETVDIWPLCLSHFERVVSVYGAD